jgi:hypothetical protein
MFSPAATVYVRNLMLWTPRYTATFTILNTRGSTKYFEVNGPRIYVIQSFAFFNLIGRPGGFQEVEAPRF